MTDGLHGHEGPLKEVTRIIGEGRDWEQTLELIQCQTCHIGVERDEPEKLRDFDCEQYAEIRGKAAEDLRETWD